MPVDVTDQYIRIRQKNPDNFVEDSFRTVTISAKEGIKAIMGKLKSDPDGSMVIQSYLFDKDKWTVNEAKKWIADHKKSANMNIEKRTFNFAIVKSEELESKKMVGHAAIFNEEADIGWFKESVADGAFKESIRKDDIRALFNHDENYVLGRNKAGTLKLKEDDKGLYVEIEPPDTQYARDLMILMERGDITQMSFAFETLQEEWIRAENKKDSDKRVIQKVKLYDVSPVTFPAYPQTDVALRSYDLWKEGQEQQEKTSQKENNEMWNIDIWRRRLQLKFNQ